MGETQGDRTALAHHGKGTAAWLDLEAVQPSPRGLGVRMRDEELRARGFEHLDLPPADLHVLAGEHFFSGRDFPDASVQQLETGDFDELKRWLGTPDALWQGGTPRRLAHNELSGPDDPRLDVDGWDALSPEALRSVEAVADAYLFSDCRPVGAYKAVLERLYGRVPVRVLRAGHLEIDAGGVLEIGGDPSVVFADEVVLHRGGRLRFTTYAHFSTASFTKLGAARGQQGET